MNTFSKIICFDSMKQPALIAFLVIVTGTTSLFAQQPAMNEFAAIDHLALLIPDSLTRTTDGIAEYINKNFKSDKEKVRAIFIWIASNIQYDIFALNYSEQQEEKILKPLKTRKGICGNYTALFNDICSKCGIKSYVIEGYIKQTGDYSTHAWCATFIDNSWMLLDPTWASGYVNNGKFIKKINNNYFSISPASLIKSHMPFDFLWQFLNYPVKNQEFYSGKVQPDKSKPYFNYEDSIRFYEKQNYSARLKSTVERIERNGVKIQLIDEKLKHIRKEIEQNK
jgi:transglutaminase/protease-like cytokinesis protein 3